MKLETNRFTFKYLASSSLAAVLVVALANITVPKCFFFDPLSSTLSPAARFLFDIIIAIFVLVPLAIFTVSCLIVAVLPISRLHSFSTALVHFWLLVAIRIIGGYYCRLVDKSTKNPLKYQEQLLKTILVSNVDTEYGRLLHFADMKNRQDFVNKHPLTTFETYRAYIDRIAETGEQNLLTKDVVVRFNVSSGTTGKAKLLPWTESSYSCSLKYFYLPFMYRAIQLRCEPSVAPLKSAIMLYSPRWRTSKSGLPIGPASAFDKKSSWSLVIVNRTIPPEVDAIYMDEPAQCYLHWLFALYDPDLVRIDGTFGGSLVAAFDFLQNNWEQLVVDVRCGRISRSQNIPMEVIMALENPKTGYLWADFQRATVLNRQFSRGFEGIVSRIWPRITTITCVVTGAHSIYLDRLRWFSGPLIQFCTLTYAASECLIGMNMDIADVDSSGSAALFTLGPLSSFFEFIPEAEIDRPTPKTMFMDQVQAGERYELVVTSDLGFYRYRLGDIVEVVRFRHGQTPVVRFCARLGSILDLIGEKTSEDTILAALKKSAEKWAGFIDLVDYTTTESVSLSKVLKSDLHGGMFYALFVEAKGISRQLSPEEIAKFDECLSETSYPYYSFRVKKSISQPKIFVLSRGTFQKMKELALSASQAVSNQYKTPRYVADEKRLQFLLKSLIISSKSES